MRQSSAQQSSTHWGIPTGRSVFSPLHIVGFLVLWALAHLAIAILQFPEALAGSQIDSDGYFRLVRVEHLLATGSWYDIAVPGSNWPYGEVIHWTRPLDVLMVALAAPFITFLPMETAVSTAGALVSVLLHGLLCVAGVWVIAPVVTTPARFLVMPALLLQPGVFAYGTVGRADHHILVLLLAFLAMGAWLRALLEPRDAWPPKMAGFLVGLALWVSPEGLLPSAAIFAGGGVAWIVGGPRYRNTNLRFCTGLVLTIGLALLAERPPGEWTTVEFDRISFAHLSMAFIAAVFWIGVGWAGEGATASPGRRAGLAALGALTGPALLHLVHPGFFQGPAAHADPRLEEIFFPLVDELQPLFPTDLSQAGDFVSHLGPVLLALPYAIYRVIRARSVEHRMMWAFLLAALLVLVPMAAGQYRLVPYAGVTLALVVTSLLGDVMEWANTMRSASRTRLVRMGSMVGLLAGFLVLGSAISHLAATAQAQPTEGAVDPPADCDVRALSRFLSDPDELGSRPRTIAAHINIGPEILYRTPHRILSGPYHRNHDGMSALLDLFTSTDSAQVRYIVQAREIELLLLCPAVDRTYFWPTHGEGRGAAQGEAVAREDSLYRQLTGGEPPSWLEVVELHGSELAGFRLFRVR